MYSYEAYRPGHANSHDEETCNGCIFRGTSEIIYRENDEQYLAKHSEDDEDSDADMEDDEGDEEFMANASAQYDPLLDSIFEDAEDAMDATDDDRDEEHLVHRECDGVRDIVLVGEVSVPSHLIITSLIIFIFTDRLQARASMEPLQVLRPRSRMGRARRTHAHPCPPST